MGHSIYLCNSITGEAVTGFPTVGEGNFQAIMVDGELKALPFQESLSITHNNNRMWYLAMRNINHPVDCVGRWLDGAIAKDIYPILIKLAEELESKPEVYQPIEPKNGWGSYKTFCKQIRVLASACVAYPDAVIHNYH